MALSVLRYNDHILIQCDCILFIQGSRLQLSNKMDSVDN